MNRRIIIFALLLIGTGMLLSGVKVNADDASDLYGQAQAAYNSYGMYDNGFGLGYDPNNYPVITAILSEPGQLGGQTYTSWILLAEDQTGSIDLTVSSSTLANLRTSNGPTDLIPAVGDGISAAGQMQMTNALADMVFTTTVSSNNYLTLQSRGNNTSAFSPLVLTINQLNTVALASNVNVEGYYIELTGVTFSGGGTFSQVFPQYADSSANVAYTLTDATGSVRDYDAVSTYYSASTLGGFDVPSGAVDVYGFMEVDPSSGLPGGGLPEFTVTSIVSVPEPSAFVLAGMGLLGLLAVRRRRS